MSPSIYTVYLHLSASYVCTVVCSSDYKTPPVQTSFLQDINTSEGRAAYGLVFLQAQFFSKLFPIAFYSVNVVASLISILLVYRTE
jgi:hypothetical protein